MRTRLSVVLLIVLALTVAWVPAGAQHDEDLHSDTIKNLTSKQVKLGKGVVAQGSDLAFDGKKVYAGTYQGTGLFKIVSKKSGFLKQIGYHQCPGSQGDLSFSGDYVFVSIDAPASNNVENAVCNNTKTNVSDSSLGKEGIRIVDFSDPKQPKQVGFIEMNCGSHTNTLVPDGDTTYMYVESYPISNQNTSCNTAGGHGEVGIIEFPTANPAKAKLIEPFDITPTPLPNDAPIGCHDLQAWPEKNIVIAACITEAQVWDISNPAKPKILARITNPDVQIWHSAAFTWDGKYAIISDEYGGAAGGGGCAGDKDSTVGAMWFYNIEDPSDPQLEGHYSLPRIPVWDDEQEAARSRCTTHLYTILPMKDGRYIALGSYYSGGISAVDFTDPANPKEIGYYLRQPGGTLPDTWSTYWYNGRIYTNDHLSGHGVGVYKMKGTGKRKVNFYEGGLNPQTQIARFK